MDNVTSSSIFFLQQHKEQLKALGIPNNLLTLLFHKLDSGIFDAGDYFQFCEIPDEFFPKNGRKNPYGLVCKKEEGLKMNSNIFVIDHDFTANKEDIMQTISTVPQLLAEYEENFGLNTEGKSPLERIEQFYKVQWEYNFPLRLLNKDTKEEELAWYLVDNVGNSIIYSKTGNCKLVPFFFMPHEKFYTLLFPIKDIEYAHLITSDYLSPLQLLEDFYNVIPLRNRFAEAHHEVISFVEERKSHVPNQSDEPYNLELVQQEYKTAPYRIFTHNNLLKEKMTIDIFKFAEDIDNADFLMFDNTLENEDFETIKGTHAWVNQVQAQDKFLSSAELTLILRKYYGEKFEEMLEPTYDLSKPESCASYVEKYFLSEEEGKPNYWVVRPVLRKHQKCFGLFDDITPVIKIGNSVPVTVCQLSPKPLLVNNKKFDFTVTILVKYDEMWESKKVDVYMCDNFVVRVAQKEFSMKNLWDYEALFTQINCGNGIVSVDSTEFEEVYKKEHEKLCGWNELLQRMRNNLGHIFNAMVKSNVLTPEVSSCALYSVDFEVDDQFHTRAKEFYLHTDYSKDIERDDQFLNNVFSTAFLESKDFKQVY
ncbi:hypothetical protein EIN_380710 [Entamoeba invadens IP1]|uniref:Tubulin--tyrosine ligase-like protein 12 SET-like domain-containing protein n=1 Tax=Entamoeba invadens IP1 TaxID=370355 RepID=A0A0A1UG12_ENTIV|nr:hypothetical protein EIN_380710 [Entamoeba invadens IP1]ELP92124.1 hypothetical protein EIN_380710 [Entamoeba invadens IP1]|eukprot:XP_004258895.1 hypothetical protein EIN_380710 [Entamoeba invadens IP1]